MSPSPVLTVRIRTCSLISICIFLAAAGLVWTTRQVAAASITVNSLSDVANGSDGACTLREAIIAANTNAASGAVAGECIAGSNTGNPDVINITVNGTINLTGVLPDITTDMDIKGPGSGLLTVRRNTGGDYRIFFVNNRNVLFSGMTITNGKTADGASGQTAGGSADGGSMLLAGGQAFLRDIVVTGNRTGNGGDSTGGGSSRGGGSGAGGGISAPGNILTMSDCVISNNVTGNGGTGSSAGGSGSGGGLFAGGPTTMLRVTIDGNRTGYGGDGISGGLSGANSGAGGGLYSSGGLQATNLTITNNVVGDVNRGSAGFGGGLFIPSGGVTLISSVISNNVTGSSIGQFSQAGFGGGIGNTANLTIIDSVVSGNTTGTGNGFGADGGSGGGIYNSANGGTSLRIINSTISSNTASGPNGNGGGIASRNVLRLTNCTISSNSAFTNDGHGVWSANVNPSARNTIIAGNGSGGTELSGSFTSQGNNLIGRSNGANGFTNGVLNDQVGSLGSPINALLGPLADNGGSTLTHALLAGSPATDAGDNCVTDAAHCGDPNLIQAIVRDQRGTPFNRLVDGPDADTTATIDIGAYEGQAPLASLPNTSTNEDVKLVVAFDAGDTSTITSISATSSDPVLVPNDSAHLDFVVTTGGSGIITINPAAELSGNTNITVTVNRTTGTESKTFLLTVNFVDDPPTFTKGPDQTVIEDAGPQTVTNWATNLSPGPPNESSQTMSFMIQGNNNPSLFASGPAISPEGTLSFTPAANANGTATISFVLRDSGGAQQIGFDTVNITVTPVNDPPSFTKGPDKTVNEDSGSQFFAPWATGLSAGPSDESSQSLTFQVTANTNAALFSSGPAINSSGQLSFTPATNANGSATISIVLKDSGGIANGGVDTSAAQTFTITVSPLNDAPGFIRGPNQTVNEDAGPQTINNWATSISPGPADESTQTVAFSITGNTNTALFSAGPAVSPNGTLTYTTAANAVGSASITLVLKDNGGTPGTDTSPSQIFGINVNPVNDAPFFTKGADQAVANNAGIQTVNNWATGITPGPSNESGQTVSFTITGNTNPNLFSVLPAVSSDGTLTYRPDPSSGGTAAITLVLQDNGGTANGGFDKSPPQTFNIIVNPVGGTINFTNSTLSSTENAGLVTVMATRTGDLSHSVTVDYATSGDNGLPCSTANGAATPKCDFIAALGTLTFAPGEDTKSFEILINQDSFVEGPEAFTVSLTNQTGGSALGTPSVLSVNIADDLTEPLTNTIDDADAFVRQQYHDFLNREADGAGLAFWAGQITSCGANAACIETKRVNVSAAFFLSIEFQQTGYLVEKMYKAAYGDATGVSSSPSSHQLSVPVVKFDEFLKDTQRLQQGVIVLQQGWEQILEGNKQSYARDFVQTSRFVAAFPTTLTPAEFVDQMFANAGVTPTTSERTTSINEFGSATTSANIAARARALRDVAESSTFSQKEFTRAFVLMEYFGYLRRNPGDAPESTLDYTGYEFWLNKLNENGGDYIKAEMVKAFISSSEYRQRFGP